MTQVTLADIAEKTGYSQTTVGKVLNGGSASIRVSAETSRRILELAHRLHYQPNAMASGLRKGQGKLIGVLTDSQAGRRISLLTQEIERQANLRSYRILTSQTHDDADSMYSNYLALLNYGAPGVICLTHDYLDMRERMREYFADDDQIVFLEQPNWGSGRYVATSRRLALTEYFASMKQRGCRRFSVIHSNLDWQSERALLADYHSALTANGIDFIPELAIQYPQDKNGIEEVCEHIISHMIVPFHPDVLYSDDAEHALYLQSHLQARKIPLPSICGGNGDAFFNYASPRISSLNPRYDLIASALLDAIIDREKFVSGVTIQAESTKEGISK